MLYPNWAGVFGLYDVRSLDAMYYSAYRSFIRSFFLGENDKSSINGDLSKINSDLSDRFTGTGDKRYDFITVNGKRFLQLSSVKYLLSIYPTFTGMTSDIFAQLKQANFIEKYQREGHIGDGPQCFAIAGVRKNVLFQHPPSFRLPYRTVINKDTALLKFAIGIHPDVYKGKVIGDGVGFTIEIKTSDAGIQKIFYKYIDPKHNVSERKWHAYELDLSKYAGKEVTLLFSTDPGPKGDNRADWAGWGDIGFAGGKVPSSKIYDNNAPFRMIYDKEVFIYEFPDVLPRASVFYSAEMIDNNDTVLARLKDRSFNIFEKAIIDCSQCKESEISLVRTISQAPPQKVEPARILSYQSQEVVVSADMKEPGILMLNDSNYPGWQVDVDGREAKILKADYLFRGVALEKGPHIIKFKYRPKSFMYGLFISAASFAGVCVLFLKFAETKIDHAS